MKKGLGVAARSFSISMMLVGGTGIEPVTPAV